MFLYGDPDYTKLVDVSDTDQWVQTVPQDCHPEVVGRSSQLGGQRNADTWTRILQTNGL